MRRRTGRLNIEIGVGGSERANFTVQIGIQPRPKEPLIFTIAPVIYEAASKEFGIGKPVRRHKSGWILWLKKAFSWAFRVLRFLTLGDFWMLWRKLPS